MLWACGIAHRYYQPAWHQHVSEVILSLSFYIFDLFLAVACYLGSSFLASACHCQLPRTYSDLCFLKWASSGLSNAWCCMFPVASGWVFIEPKGPPHDTQQATAHFSCFLSGCLLLHRGREVGNRIAWNMQERCWDRAHKHLVHCLI